MRLDLREIIEVPGASIPFSCELETEGLDFPSILCYHGKPHAEGRVYNEAGVLHLEGTLTAEMTCVCDRCGEPFDSVKETALEAVIVEEESEEHPEFFVLDGNDLDLDEVAVAAQLEDRAPADDADMPDAEDLDDAMGLDDVMPLPATGYGDDFDPDDMMAMSAFQSRSVLGAEERNAVIQEVKQRAEKNGGYVTYDELNQIVPATVQDESTADEYLLILQALNVDVIRAEDVEAYRANKDKQGDSRLHAARVQEMFDDPIRMYLHQMGQVPLLTREQVDRLVRLHAQRLEHLLLEVELVERVHQRGARVRDGLLRARRFVPGRKRERPGAHVSAHGIVDVHDVVPRIALADGEQLDGRGVLVRHQPHFRSGLAVRGVPALVVAEEVCGRVDAGVVARISAGKERV